MKILPSGISAQGSFKRQIILTLVLGFFLLAVVFTTYQVRTESTYLYRDSVNDASSLAESLAASSRSWVLANDVVGLQEVIHSFQSHPGLAYVMVISPAGQVLAHSDAAKVGKFLSDERSLTLIKAPPLPQVMVDSESMIDIAVPIMVDHRHVGWARAAQGRERIATYLNTMILNGALFVLSAMILSLFLALLIAKRLGYRIGYLMRVAAEVKAGNYDTRANISGNDEIGKLNSSLNQMLDVLARDEEQLRTASLYTRSLIEASLDPLVTISPEGKITDINQATEKVTGRSRTELLGTDFSDYFTEPDNARAGYQQVFQEGSVTDYSLALRHRDGHVTDVLYNASVYRNEAGKVLGVFAAARDVTERNKAEISLRESEALLQATMKILPVGLWVFDAEGKIVFSNDAAKQLWAGVRYVGIEQLGEYKGWRLGNRESIGPHEWAGARALEKGETSIEEEVEIECFDGTHKIILDSAVPLRRSDGSIRGAVTINQDITERKSAEFVLRQSEEALKEAQRMAHVGSWHMDLATNEVVWSEVLYELYGFDPALPPPLYTESMKLFIPESWERLSTSIARAVESGIPYELELEMIPKDGGRKWMLARGELVRDAHGAPVRVRGVVMDITERRRMESQLAEREYQFRTLAENSPDVIVRYDREGRRIYVNPEFERVNHLTAQEVYGKKPLELSTELKPKADVFTEQLMAAMASGKFTKVDLSWIKDGKQVCWFVRVVPEFDAKGNVVSALTIWSDISERKQAEDELREREMHSQSLLRLSRGMERSQTYAEALNAAQDEVKTITGYQSLWVYLLSEDKQYLKALVAGGEVSDTVMSEEGTATLTIKGDRMLEEIAASKEIVLVEDARTDDRVNKKIAESMGMRTVVNIPIMLFDRHMGCVGTGTFGDEGVRVPSGSEQKYLIAMASHMAVALDRIHLLAERRKAEMALRELNSDFVTLLESTGDYIYFKDQDSRIRFCSQTLANITGFPSWRDMIGKHDLEIFPEDTARIYYEEELPIFKEGKALLNKTDPYYDAQGKPGWVNSNKWPVFSDDKKTVVGIFGISRDITELKEAEDKVNELNSDLEQRVNERTAQLEAANKELESFSYSVSHDLRAPLRAIDGFSHILLDDYSAKLDEEGRRLLNVVSDNTNRMGQLIDDILKFSRTGRLELNFSEIDMEGMARSVVEELQTGAVAGRKLQVEIDHLPSAMGDQSMMHQVFVNLLSNAIKFTGSKETAMIKVGGSIEGNEAVYYVKDNGAGFDMQYADKLFGVFQRLHGMNEFEGTGIGLAIVKRIINRHGGRVWAEGKVNEGATIYFALPKY
jgi:PAS domain S-box-containing protein